MAYNSNLITAPVSFFDVQQALSTSQKDLGTLCQLAAINKWAKFKPFRTAKPAIVPVVDASGFPTEQSAVGSHYQYLISTNCGLYINYRNYGRDACIQKVRDMMAAGNDDDIWTYQPPTGGSSQPFRLVDFCGYLHTALPFLWQANITDKKIPYRGSQDEGRGVDFNIEIYDSNNETVQGMIEADDLNDTIYNSNDLFYFVALCNPATWEVMAASIATHSINHADGKTCSFSIYHNNSGWLIAGNNVESTRTGVTKYKVVHMLCRVVNGSLDSWIPIPYSSSFPPITSMEIQSTRTSVEFDINSLANFVSNGSAISGLTFQSINNDISVNNWTGVTVKLNLTNSSANPVTINFGDVYCQTNCHSVPVACTAKYNSNYQLISGNVTVPAASGGTPGSVAIYMTFADVFDFDTNNGVKIDNMDVEISFWGEDSQGNATISAQTWGNDGTIIYHT